LKATLREFAGKEQYAQVLSQFQFPVPWCLLGSEFMFRSTPATAASILENLNFVHEQNVWAIPLIPTSFHLILPHPCSPILLLFLSCMPVVSSVRLMLWFAHARAAWFLSPNPVPFLQSGIHLNILLLILLCLLLILLFEHPSSCPSMPSAYPSVPSSVPSAHTQDEYALTCAI
jgi:hypothetical protein